MWRPEQELATIALTKPLLRAEQGRLVIRDRNKQHGDEKQRHERFAHNRNALTSMGELDASNYLDVIERRAPIGTPARAWLIINLSGLKFLPAQAWFRSTVQRSSHARGTAQP